MGRAREGGRVVGWGGERGRGGGGGGGGGGGAGSEDVRRQDGIWVL